MELFLEPVLTELDPDVGKDLTYVSKGVLGVASYNAFFVVCSFVMHLVRAMKANQCFYENRFSHAPLYNPSGFAVNLNPT